MGRTQRWIPLALAAAFGACGPAAGTTTPGWVDTSGAYNNEYSTEYLTRLFEPCTMNASVDPAKRSFAAMILALQEQNWTIQKMVPETNTIFGDICYRDDNRFCAVVVFRAGDLAVQGKPDFVQPQVRDDLERWFVALERSFNKYRCYTDPVLRDELAKYGIVY